MRIDAHQHFWNYVADKHAWIDDKMQVIKRDFLPEDLAPILKANNFSGCIAVQADQSEAETEFLLGLASNHDFIKGVVGWVDLRCTKLKDRLDYYSQFEKLKGWRHVVQSEPDDDFMLRDDFLDGISLLADYNHTYDILIVPKQLSAALRLVQLFPRQKFIIDHIAKPDIIGKEIEEWKSAMNQLGLMDNVWCKVSGMVTEADWSGWRQSDFTPYLEVVFSAFGADKVVFGSDWPVCQLGASYEQVVNIPTEFIETYYTKSDLGFWGPNASEFYNLP